MNKAEILRQVDAVIADGPYADSWESLCRYTPPQWYADAKFGIFIHWGIYSVPAFGNEWYPRNMYKQGSPEFEHHVKTWGPQDKFGYKDFIPLFGGEKFDAGEWMRLFRDAGANYVMPVAEHHDGFQMYASDLSDWNAAKMGPKRDVIGELRDAAEKEGIVFSVSSHRAEHCWFFNTANGYDNDVSSRAFEDFYWNPEDNGGDASHDVRAAPPSTAHCEDWLARTCELVDKYRPRIVWFDWWINNLGFKPLLKKFAAYYYNRAARWGVEVAINYKYNAYAYGSAVFDVERGQLAAIRPRLWQTDTAVARNSWGYTENNRFKTPQELVCDLVDIVSKNGCLLLNIGPRADGTITDEDRAVLLGIGRWLAANGEGIYGTTFWQQFGEGPTNVAEGAFTDGQRLEYTPRDIRFTYKGGVLYAFVLRWPESGEVLIPALKSWDGQPGSADFDILSARALGSGAEVRFERRADGLLIKAGGVADDGYPVGFALALD